MRVVVQRSLNSSVSVDNKIVGSIDKGLVLLVGFTQDDDSTKIDYMVKKIVNLSFLTIFTYFSPTYRFFQSYFIIPYFAFLVKLKDYQ